MVDPGQLPALPSLSDWLSKWLGFQIPTLPLPQTLKNLDKAFGRIVLASGKNIASRFEANTARRQARSRADVEIIDSAAQYASEKLPVDSTLAERATHYAFAEGLLKQQNREKIFERAMHELANEAPAIAREISGDWLNEFSEIAARKSSEDIQILWGKILAGEIRSPGSFSLQFLKSLSYIDSVQAKEIYELMRYVVDEHLIYRIGPVNDISMSKALEMEELGLLIATATPLINTLTVPAEGTLRALFLSGVAVGVTASTEIKISLPAYPLTSFGKQLFKLTNPPEAPENYICALVDDLKGRGITVKRAEIIEKDGQGRALGTEWRDA